MQSVSGSGYIVNSACTADCKPMGAGYDARLACSWISPKGECTGGTTCLGGDRPFGFCL